MLIYRVEFECGFGPYTARNGDGKPYSYYSRMITQHMDLDKYPDAQSDSGWAFSHHYFCGFKNLQQLLSWFDDFLEEIIYEGGMIAMYEVPKDFILDTISGKQIGFRKDMAELVGYVVNPYQATI